MAIFPFLQRPRTISEQRLTADELNGFVLHSYVTMSRDGLRQEHVGVMKNYNADIVVVCIRNEIDGPPSRLYEYQIDLDPGSDDKHWLIADKPIPQNAHPSLFRIFASPIPASGTVQVHLEVRLQFSHFRPYSASDPLSW